MKEGGGRGILKYKLFLLFFLLEERGRGRKNSFGNTAEFSVVKAFVGWLTGVFWLCWALTSLQVTWQSGPFPSQLLTQKAVPILPASSFSAFSPSREQARLHAEGSALNEDARWPVAWWGIKLPSTWRQRAPELSCVCCSSKAKKFNSLDSRILCGNSMANSPVCHPRECSWPYTEFFNPGMIPERYADGSFWAKN